MENLQKHLKGLSKEVDGILKGLPIDQLPEDLSNEIKKVQDTLDFSTGENLELKQQKLNNVLNAITNYKRNV
jgi:hypothetical protein